MNDWNDEPSRASIEKIVSKLREPIHLDETFDVRVMSAVHAAALAECDATLTRKNISDDSRGPWWQRTYTLRFSAWSGVAMAASIFGIMVLGATILSRGSTTTPAPRVASVAPAANTPVQNVHFILVNGSAQQVYLVGDFNGWSKTQTPLVRSVNGSAWTVAVPLQQGRHEYAFIVSDEKGEHWVADPLTRVHEDEFGTESSVVSIEPSSTTATM